VTDADSITRAAQDLADRLLFPTALETDASDLVPRSHLDVLANAGLFGLVGPSEYGGLGADVATFCSVVEALAGGCLSTTFVWIQHHTPVRTIAASGNAAMQQEWLPRLCSGETRAGIALGGLRAGPTQIEARRVDDGWLLDGDVPYITGWGHIDVLFVAARTATTTPEVVTALVSAEASPALAVEPLRLLATNASGTVRATIRSLFVPDERVIGVQPYHSPPPFDGGGRPNGSLSLGVAKRCCAVIGPGPLDAEVDQRRQQLDSAGDETMAEARAAASELALRAAAALVVARGSASLFPQQQAQRLLREATFLQVFGSRPAIRDALLRRLGATGS
jgi:alkylation response protein AidB-like acyl-CoA dehydrogenase